MAKFKAVFVEVFLYFLTKKYSKDLERLADRLSSMLTSVNGRDRNLKQGQDSSE